MHHISYFCHVHRHYVRHYDISRDLHLLNRSISDGISRNCDTDDIVALFTQFLTDRADPYFKKRYIPRKESFVNHTSRLKKQKWYNEECKLKREAYISALHNFNSDRNSETRKIMLEAKKDYKYYCRSCKLKYSYEQGRKMNEMRKKQPREFWKMYKHKKQTPTESEISTENFYQYFKSLSNQDPPFVNMETDNL